MHMSNQKKFIFNGYDFNLQNGRADFRYEIVGEENYSFKETIQFPEVNNQIPESLLKSIFEGLLLVLGISYWKLCCPNIIEIKNFSLTKEQADFWNILYTKGLGEFFYKNKIDFRGLVNFPFDKNLSINPTQFPRKERYLVGVGGGKDSIVVTEQFRKQGKDFDILLLGESRVQKEVASIMGKYIINIKRNLDPKIFELNKSGKVYNGHIPMSSIIAFLSIMAACFYDYKYSVVANEKSANYGNIEYLGEMINHQWSKSEEFEKLFNDYVTKFITPGIKYSSPLRDMTELQVVEKFVQYPQYFKVFSSCNRNFRINNPSHKKWCGECPKCLFVFISLAAFLPKEEVLDIFGKNLFEDKNLIPLFEELVGARSFKPFECVGTQEEAKEALRKVLERGEFSETILMKHSKILWN
jgi:hypothetical protein